MRDSYWVIHKLAKENHIKIKDIAESMGITPQSLNKSLRGRISLEVFSKAVKACGYDVLIGRDKDIRKLEDF